MSCLLKVGWLRRSDWEWTRGHSRGKLCSFWFHSCTIVFSAFLLVFHGVLALFPALERNGCVSCTYLAEVVGGMCSGFDTCKLEANKPARINLGTPKHNYEA